MIYLIGVNHGVQYQTEKNDPAQAKIILKFKNYLDQKIQELKICVLAEEMSQYALEKNHATKHIVKEISHKNQIEHLMCDPSPSERKKLGITSALVSVLDKEAKKYFPQREQFWLDKISNKLLKNVIFICGNQHISTFSILLKHNGVNIKVLSENWGKVEFDIDPFAQCKT